MLFGVSAVQLYLLNTVILFLSREAIRRSTLRFAAPPEMQGSAGRLYERAVLFNLSWLSIVGAIPLCFVVRALFLASAPSFATADTSAEALSRSTHLSADYIRCLNLYTLASWVELLAEPLYILGQKQQKVRFRVVVDGAAVLVRCIATFVCLMGSVGSSSNSGGSLLAFAYGQMAYACVIVAGYYSQCFAPPPQQKDDTALVPRFSDVLPRRLPVLPAGTPASSFVGRYIDPSLLRLTGEVSLQSLEKLLLQEGEKLVLVSLAPSTGNLDAQGVYGLVQNLGSLVARMVFQPLEEAAFMEFSMGFAGVTADTEKNEDERAATVTVGGTAKTKTKTVVVQDSDSNEGSACPSVSHSAAYASGLSQLGLLLHLVSLVGLILLCFGPAYSYVFLHLLYGSKWSSTDAPQVLSGYCVYILFMAANGISEAFVSAVMSTRQLRHYNLFLVCFSAAYLAACAGLMRFGSAGLVLANVINMAMRIAYSSWFIRRFFAAAPPAAVTQQQDGVPASPRSLVHELWTRILPDAATCASCILSLLVTQLSFRLCGIAGSHSLTRFAAHISVGVACVAMVMATIWRRERAFLAQMRGLATKRKRT